MKLAVVLAVASFYSTVGAASARAAASKKPKPSSDANVTSSWSLVEAGKLGVSALQLVVVGSSSVVILDRQEGNPLQWNGQPAMGQWLNLATNKTAAFGVYSNALCGLGSIVSNGSIISMGGHHNQANAADGRQSIRIISADDTGASNYENPARIRMSGWRWCVRCHVYSLTISGTLARSGCPMAQHSSPPALSRPRSPVHQATAST